MCMVGVRVRCMCPPDRTYSLAWKFCWRCGSAPLRLRRPRGGHSGLYLRAANVHPCELLDLRITVCFLTPASRICRQVGRLSLNWSRCQNCLFVCFVLKNRWNFRVGFQRINHTVGGFLPHGQTHFALSLPEVWMEKRLLEPIGSLGQDSPPYLSCQASWRWVVAGHEEFFRKCFRRLYLQSKWAPLSLPSTRPLFVVGCRQIQWAKNQSPDRFVEQSM